MKFDKRSAFVTKTFGGVMIRYPFQEPQEWKPLLAPGVLDLLLLKFGKESEESIREAVQSGRKTYTQIEYYLRHGNSTAC